MESGASWDRNMLLNMLTQGEEQMKQLEARLDEPSQSEFCKALSQKIQSTLRTAISMAKLMDSEGSRQLAWPNNTGSDSPLSASESPRSENSDRPFKDQERTEMSKKRKTLPKWTSQVSVSSGTGTEGPLDDGYSWRKYGQKDILGAKYPRGYYRCTHRNVQGCPATKQVQRSDENPSVFEVTYRGAHACLQRPRWAPMQQNQPIPSPDQDQQHHHEDQQFLPSSRTGLDVKTEGLGSEVQDPTSSSFSFPSTPVSCMKPESHTFSSPSTLGNHLMGSFSPKFVSTSESNYFSLSPCRMSNYVGGQSDLTDIVSATTSAANSPIVDIDFVLEPVELDTNFPFDASNFFS